MCLSSCFNIQTKRHAASIIISSGTKYPPLQYPVGIHIGTFFFDGIRICIASICSPHKYPTIIYLTTPPTWCTPLSQQLCSILRYVAFVIWCIVCEAQMHADSLERGSCSKRDILNQSLTWPAPWGVTVYMYISQIMSLIPADASLGEGLKTGLCHCARLHPSHRCLKCFFRESAGPIFANYQYQSVCTVSVLYSTILLNKSLSFAFKLRVGADIQVPGTIKKEQG